MTAKRYSLWLAALALIATQANAVDVTVAYQTSAEPAKVAQADNAFAKDSGAKVEWRKFDSGASVVRALASGMCRLVILAPARWLSPRVKMCRLKCFCLPPSLGTPKRWW